jgi:glycosyltransferase involved in cell wall biosynthesis
MKISICIPQYNRIAFLLKNLEWIAKQSYNNVEVVVSDDCSKDTTDEEIRKLIPTYKYPIIYKRNEKNLGYDGNLRRSMELATGDYCFILGNDDTLNQPNDIQFLVDFLKENNYPEVGFCNSSFFDAPENTMERASKTQVIGSGTAVAIKYFRSFSFVAGIILKKSCFEEVNTPRFDGSIYVQIYLCTTLVARGYRLFTIKEPLVLQNITIENMVVNSYLDTLQKKWKDYKVVDAGLPQVIHVAIHAFKDAGHSEKDFAYIIFRGIYSITYPFWILDYKRHGALVAAVGLMNGMKPYNVKDFNVLGFTQKAIILFLYYFSTISAFVFPTSLFEKIKYHLYRLIKK